MKRIYGIFVVVLAFAAGTALGIGIGIAADGDRENPVSPAGVRFASEERAAQPRLAPALATERPMDFADIVQNTTPAVVGITNIRRGGEEGGVQRFHERILPWWFFREAPPDGEDRRFQEREEGTTAGSGFFVSDDGYILTNNHVAENTDRLLVTRTDGRQYDAKVIGTDPSIDLALIKIEPEDGERFPTLSLGDSESLRVGEWVIAIGNPLGFEMTVTVGVVSAKNRRVNLPGTDYGVAEFVQTDAAINLGNSGGPLLDAYGRVVGINTAINRANMAEGIGFALQISEARKAMDQLLETGEVKRGLIGIRMSTSGIDREAQRYLGLPDLNGVLIERVTEDGPADRAGLRRGDVIRRIDGQAIRGNDELLAEISSRRPGEKVRLQVFRDGKEFEATAKLVERTTASLRADGGARQFDSGDEEEGESGKASGLGMKVETLDTGNINPMLQRSVADGLRGVIVTEVEFGSQAADKGIQPGQVVVAVNDSPVAGVGDWSRLLEGADPGDTVKLDLSALDGSSIGFVFLTVPE